MKRNVVSNIGRRSFLISASGTIAGAASVMGRAASIPCPPPSISVSGGGTAVSTCSSNGGGALAALAASLAAGASSLTLGDSGLDQNAANTIQWANRFHYDSARGRAHMLGKNASATGSQRSNCLYNSATNTWTSAVFGGNELGHVYESIAYDPAQSEVYSGTWAASTLKKWKYGSALDSWIDPVATYSAQFTADTQPALCWHPNLFGPGDGGLLAIKASSATATLGAWRRSSGTWTTVAGISQTIGGNYPIQNAGYSVPKRRGKKKPSS